ncbi:MAG: hypothetical protein A2663_04970 [Candidatus Buchananbacteria bacterium RIFCSPHIGHO2_01_FULL_46_12]|uniref:Uncharacterized protein n=1 Tax=Candidatus Buchananbacteria bacterium RIFCSPHIGHO2_01_FULL_46_12 TaxID=1797536 RepID=A0A1G1Y5J0_9BACT|nr:MAG: hypothetical protein A2663_04970 [Candidatus Buchananbacteria bacterium RIFCSPHIGHO2_01_FULL_46_12]
MAVDNNPEVTAMAETQMIYCPHHGGKNHFIEIIQRDGEAVLAGCESLLRHRQTGGCVAECLFLRPRGKAVCPFESAGRIEAARFMNFSA